ncbi:hypothetical protein ACJMK2_038692 [Sinanodonta woodiana]|uniref:Serine protease n=1 Tax=Sinanodonta woodiana TaxID=1069815 RepID=A0ABD3WAU8_SINWO
MDCFGFCGEKCSKKKKKTKEKYKEEVNKETNEMPVPLRNEIQFPGSAEDVQQIETTSESLLQASQETGDLCPHVVPSGVGNPASLDHNVNQVSDEMPNKSRTEQTMKLTHDVKKKKPSKPKHRHYQNNQDSSDSETDSSSDSSCDESSSADDSNDSPVERTSTSKTKKKSRTKIINAPGGIVDFGRNNKNKIVHISYGGQKKKKKNKDKDRSSRNAEPHMNRTQTEHDFPGNFHKICDETDTISNMEMIVEVAKSVGIIRSPLVQGTGFRVGDSYIMTANHVVEGIINPVLQPLDDRERGQKLKLLGDRKVHIDFDFKLPVDASQQGQVVQGNTLRFNFEPQILYQNKALDTAVLKLKHSSSKFPHQLTRFCHCLENLPMYFIGHSNHEVKKFDKTNPRDLTESEIKQCQIWSKQHQIGCRENYRGYEGAADPRKILFDCSATFNKGASGSPGFIVSSHDKMPYVVSMLLRGYPDWYHDEKVKEKMCIPREYSFEQGVRITEVYKDMKANNPGLCSEIFGT